MRRLPFAAGFAALAVPVAASPMVARTMLPSILTRSTLTAWGDPELSRPRGPTIACPKPTSRSKRPETDGTRLTMTDEEFAKRLAEARKSDAGYEETVDADRSRPAGLAAWVQTAAFARRTSLIVSPANGRLPRKTPQGEALFNAGRNSWVDKQAIDWVSDLDSYDRCISRGFPAAMLPWPNNSGMRIFQAPGSVVVLQLEVLGTRIIPLRPRRQRGLPLRCAAGWARAADAGRAAPWSSKLSQIVTGDSATGEALKRAGSPVTGRGGGVMPMGPEAHTVERLRLTGPGTLAYPGDTPTRRCKSPRAKPACRRRAADVG